MNAEALVTIKDGQVPVMLINPTEHDVEYNKGTILAKMKPLEEGYQVIPLREEYIRTTTEANNKNLRKNNSEPRGDKLPPIKGGEGQHDPWSRPET